MPLNKEFEYDMLEAYPGGLSEYKVKKRTFKPGTWCMGTILINTIDAERIGIKTGILIELENPLGRKQRGRAFVGEGIRPGIIKMGFATGGRFSTGLGAAYIHKDYTPSHNELVDLML